jgi:DNA-binding NarL/FixJ family response regulator
MPNIRILVADDTTLIRRLLAGQLAREPGFEVVGEAEDGRAAVELARSSRPDIILMDLNMPYLNGVEATERILAQQPTVKVILLTAHEDLAALGRLSGAAESLDKSCTPQEIAAAIRQVYATARAAAQSNAADASPNETHAAAIQRLAARHALTERERAVVEKVVTTDLTIGQIAMALSAEAKTEVTSSSVKHTLERAMTKLRVEPRTRAALVKHVLDFGSTNK